MLGIPPTLDRAAVKRAYFDALSRCPPHRDAEAFARVRGAYEALTRPGGLEAAWLLLPVDFEAEAAPIRDRYDAALDQARQRARERREGELIVSRFVERASTSSMQELCEAFCKVPGQGSGDPGVALR